LKDLISKYLPQEYKLLEVHMPKLEAHFIIETVNEIYQVTIDLLPDPEQSAELVATELVKTMWEIEPPEVKDKKDVN